jgi:hypothetical protein
MYDPGREQRPGDHRVVPSNKYDLVTADRPYSLHLYVLLQNQSKAHNPHTPQIYDIPYTHTQILPLENKALLS